MTDGSRESKRPRLKAGAAPSAHAEHPQYALVKVPVQVGPIPSGTVADYAVLRCHWQCIRTCEWTTLFARGIGTLLRTFLTPGLAFFPYD